MCCSTTCACTQATRTEHTSKHNACGTHCRQGCQRLMQLVMHYTAVVGLQVPAVRLSTYGTVAPPCWQSVGQNFWHPAQLI
jgi:hypothetical protein